MHRDVVFGYMTAKWVYGYGLPLHVLSRSGVREGSLLALFGSGMGKTAFLAAKRFGCRVVGVEIMPSLVQHAKRKAEAENMEDRLTFLHIDEYDYLRRIKPDFVFYESILSFLPNPHDFLKKYFPSTKHVGVLELSWLRQDIAEHKKELLKDVFGRFASFRQVDEWVKMFNDIGFEVLEKGVRGLGFFAKFWDDMRADRFGTLAGICKTIYKTFTDQTARKYTLSFRNFLKQYSDDMGCAYFIIRPAHHVFEKEPV